MNTECCARCGGQFQEKELKKLAQPPSDSGFTLEHHDAKNCVDFLKQEKDRLEQTHRVEPQRDPRGARRHPGKAAVAMNELERHTEKGGLLPLEYVRIAPGWWRCDCPTIMDGLVVRYYRAKEPWNHHKPDQVSASRNGVCVNVDATSGPELVELIAIVRVAQRQHLRIGELGRGDPCSPHQDAEIFVKEIRS